MAMHDGDPLFDQLTSKESFLVAELMTPVFAPVDRRHDHITVAAETAHFGSYVTRSFLRNVLEKIDSGPVGCRGPFPWNATCRRSIRKDHYAAFPRHIEHRWGGSLRSVTSCAGVGDARSVERSQGLCETCVAPVEDMIIGEATAVNARCGDTIDITWMHPVMDSLVAPVVVAGSDAGLQIDDAQVYSSAIKFRLCIAPDIVKFRPSRDGAAHPLSEFHVAACVTDERLVQRGIAGMRQDLVDA